MNRNLLLIFLISVLSANSIAQSITPEQLGFKAYTIQSSKYGEINYYVTTNKIDEQKPVLLYLDGSGAFPLFQKTGNGIRSAVALDFQQLSDRYHIVLISKPGVPFFDIVTRDERTREPQYETPAEYSKRLSLDWRVNSARLVLKDLNRHIRTDKRKVAVLGISEGFQAGAKLASVEKKITHSVLLVGNGLNQFYDFIIQNRTDAQTGRISQEQAQQNIDSIVAVAQKIYEHPHDSQKEWYGHSYLRWASFTSNNPTENILSLKTPVYIVAAANDRNTSALGTDYLYLESKRLGKTNIEYKVYPYDHFFNESIKDETGKVISTRNHMTEVLTESIDWLDRQ